MPALWEQRWNVSKALEKALTSHLYKESWCDAMIFHMDRITLWIDGTRYVLTINRARDQYPPPVGATLLPTVEEGTEES